MLNATPSRAQDRRLRRDSLPARLLALLVLAASPAVSAQDSPLQLAAFVVTSGGGRSDGGGFSISGALSSSGAARLSGGDFVLEQGLWNPETGSVTTRPSLTLVRVAARVELRWPVASSAGFQLQQSLSLVPGLWSDVEGTPVLQGDEQTLLIPVQAQVMYFRLRRP